VKGDSVEIRLGSDSTSRVSAVVNATERKSPHVLSEKSCT